MEERRSEFVGLVNGVFRVVDMLEGSFDDIGVADVEIYDAGDGTGEIDGAHFADGQLLFDRDTNESAFVEGAVRHDVRVVEIDVGGRLWRMFIQFSPDAVQGGSDQYLLVVTIIAGLLLSIAGGLFAFSRARSASRRLLETSEERFRTLVDAAPEGILIVDESGVILLANRQIQEMFGYSQEDLVGQPVERLMSEDHRAPHGHHLRGFMDDPRCRSMGAGEVFSGRRRDGTEFPVAIGLAPLPGGDEKLVAATVTDMTARMLAEGKLVTTNSYLEQYVEDLQEIREKAAMLSAMSELLQLSENHEEARLVHIRDGLWALAAVERGSEFRNGATFSD